MKTPKALIGVLALMTFSIPALAFGQSLGCYVDFATGDCESSAPFCTFDFDTDASVMGIAMAAKCLLAAEIDSDRLECEANYENLYRAWERQKKTIRNLKKQIRNLQQ